jgi:hypothetical protein
MLRLAVFCGLLSSVVAHTHMFFPEPRNRQDYQFTVKGANACENERTDLTDKNTFFRGQSFEPKWWWCVYYFKLALKLKVNWCIGTTTMVSCLSPIAKAST